MTLAPIDIAVVVFLTIICLLICIGNGLVFTAVLCDRKLRNKSNAFILCLAVADLMVAIFNIPLTTVSIIFPKWRAENNVICRFSGFFEMLFLVASVQSLSVIGINRFYFVVHWQKYHNIFTRGRVCFIILGVWTLSVLLCTPPLIGWGAYGYKETKNHCFVVWRSDLAYTYFMVIMCFVGPIVAMGVCYYRIFMFNRQRKIKRWSWLQKKPTLRLTTPNESQNPKELNTRGLRKQRYNVENAVYTQGSGLKVPVQSMMTTTFVKETSSSFSTVPSYSTVIEKASSASEINVEEMPAEENTQSGEHMERYQQPVSQDVLDFNTTNCKTKNRNKQNDIKKSNSTKGKREIKTQHPLYSPLQKDEHTTEASNSTNNSVINKSSIMLSIDDDSVASDVSNNSVFSWKQLTPAPAKKEKTSMRKTYSPQISKAERKLSMMLGLMVIIFIIAWLPFVITMFVEFYTKIRIPQVLDRTALFIGYTNSLCNPIIYGFMNQRFRTVYKKIFLFVFRCQKINSFTSTDI